MSNAPDFSTPKKEVVEYYENFCKKFELTGSMAASIDGDRYDYISASAVCDIISRAPVRTREAFDSDAEFELYKASMYGEVLRIKSGSWMK